MPVGVDAATVMPGRREGREAAVGASTMIYCCSWQFRLISFCLFVCRSGQSAGGGGVGLGLGEGWVYIRAHSLPVRLFCCSICFT